MVSTVDYEKRDLFVSRVHSLLEDMRKWLDGTGLVAKTSEIIVNEKTPGDYTVDQLEIVDKKGEPVAKVTPVGAYVIAAEGRVDIEGFIGKESIVFMKGSPDLQTNSAGEKRTGHFYTGIDHDGWYWIENKRRIKALSLDRELFLELITIASDYGF